MFTIKIFTMRNYSDGFRQKFRFGNTCARAALRLDFYSIYFHFGVKIFTKFNIKFQTSPYTYNTYIYNNPSVFFFRYVLRFSGLIGDLRGLGGYNGLPSVMSGLDESLSDVAPRKKYPFELEKAIHNVMFIQHHMQRQDEFNAVSIPRQIHPRNLIQIIHFHTFYVCCVVVFTGRSGLGIRGHGTGSSVPVDFHHCFDRRYFCHPLRSSSSLRRHQTH